MAEVTLTINGRHYDIACDPGQEGRLINLASFVDEKIASISQNGAAYNDSHLQILSLLLIADELFETREGRVSHSQAGVAAMKSEIETEVRNQVEAEYAERLEKLQAQLSNVDTQDAPQQSDVMPFEETEDGKSVMKVLKHLSDRVNGLAERLETL